MADEVLVHTISTWVQRTREAHAIIKDQERDILAYRETLRAVQHALGHGNIIESREVLKMVNEVLGEEA